MARTVPKQKPGLSKQEYQTPPEFIGAILRKCRIEAFIFDVAADALNTVAVGGYFSKADDALVQDWPRSGWNFLNPPFEDIAPWVKKAYMQGRLGAHTAVLIPASSGANWWKLWVDQKARVLQLNGRITFVGESDPYPKDCALLLYGPSVEPGYEVWSWMDDLTEDEKQMAKKARDAVKAKKNKDNVTEFKAKRGRPRKDAAPTMPELPEPQAPRMELAVGSDILLPEPLDAVRLLGELATLNDQALAAGKVYEDLKERTKTAKEKYDELAERVLTRLRVGTHASDLPLFSADEREADQRRMEQAALEGRQEVADEPQSASDPVEGETASPGPDAAQSQPEAVSDGVTALEEESAIF